MSENLKNVTLEGEDEYQDDSLGTRLMDWIRTELVWYAGSFSVHLLGLSLLLLVANAVPVPDTGDGLVVESAKAEPEQFPERLDDLQYVIGPPEASFSEEINPDPTLELPGQKEVTERYYDDRETFTEAPIGRPDGKKQLGSGGSGGLDVIRYGDGPKLAGPGGIGFGKGVPDGVPGGYGPRNSGHRKAMLAGGGGTERTERGVTGALLWLARHQNKSDGSWSLKDYSMQCKGGTCSGPGNVQADAGATAMALLPFLAWGQTHRSKCYYRRTVADGLNWLVRHQKPDGNLASGCTQMMYSHGLATITLCEAYGMTGDPNVGRAAQAAVNFIIAAQNKGTGGWRYNPGEPGDTSVVGWQIMALKSAAMAGLSVSGGTGAFEGSSKWLDSCAKGEKSSQYSYRPEDGPSPTMTSVGLLCRQYLGAKRDDPMMTEGRNYFLANLPTLDFPNCYYWYYASQVMHNMPGYEWDKWNRAMRKLLVETQCRDSKSCANGSWDPEKDMWGKHGGRIMMTSLCCLTLEIYYRYLPLFKTDAQGGHRGPVPKAEK